MHSAPLNGLILAGGKSSRMGFDKGLVKVAGVTQRDRLFRLMTTCCDKTYFSCRGNSDKYSPFPVLEDRTDFEGPMAGLVTAFTVHPESAWLVVAIDMIGVVNATLSYLIRARDASCIATCFIHADNGIEEPLLTIWEKSALPVVRLHAGKGDYSLMSLLRSQAVNRVVCGNHSWLLNQNYAGTGPFGTSTR